MSNKYTITFIGKQASINIVVRYDTNGLLKEMRFEEDNLEKEAVYFCLMRIPITEDGLSQLSTMTYGTIQVQQVPNDLSFNAFWELYAYKIGNKNRCITLWTALTEPDRIQCLRKIPQYLQYLRQKPHMEKLYPETFLKQRRFEAEYKIV